MSPVLYWSYFFAKMLGFAFYQIELPVRPGHDIHLIADFQSEIGCSADWDDHCAITEFKPVGNVYRLNLTIPAGTWNFKLADQGVLYGRSNKEDGTAWTFKLTRASYFIFEYVSAEHKLNFQTANGPLEARSLPPSPVLPTLTLTDTLIYDSNGNMTANPADSIRYTIILRNETGQSVLNALINHSGDPNVTFDPGSLKASPLAFNDTFQFVINPLVISAPGILTNDFDLNDPLPNPPFYFNLFVHKVESNQANVGNTITTAAGGMITLNPDGSLTYDSTGIQGALADSVLYSIQDADGFEDSARIMILFNAPPVIASGLAATDTICAFEQQDTFVMTPVFSIVDDGTTITSAKIAICNGHISPEDTLVYGTLPMGVTASWTEGSGTLMLMGAASLADYENAIESIQYINQSNMPNPVLREVCITVSDGATSNEVRRWLKVKLINDCPLAVRDTFTLNENAVFPPSNVLTNDTDPEMDPLTVNPVVMGQMVNGGMWSVDGSGGFSFTHTMGPMGLDTLNVGQMFFARVEYGVSDGFCTDKDSVIIKITGINDAPVADPDTFSGSEQAVLNIPAPGVLMGDDDIDHLDVPMVGIVEGLMSNVGMNTMLTSGAVLNVSPNGSFTYTPSCLGIKVDSFHYQVVDGNGAFSNPVTVIINLTQRFWFVQQGAMPGTAGSFNAPFDMLSDAQAASAPGDYIFVFPGQYTENLTLKNDQKLIGAVVNWICLPQFTGLRSAGGTSRINGTVTLAMNDTILGITMGEPSMAALNSFINTPLSSVGSLRICQTKINQGIGGGITILAGGLLDICLDSLRVGPTNNAVTFVNCSGDADISNGVVSLTSDTAILILGGTVSLNFYNSNISSAASMAPVLAVGAGHSGTIQFITGSMSATNGTGLQFSDSKGNYDFGSIYPVYLQGGDAGIDIHSGSSGRYIFSSTSSRIFNPTNQLFTINASSSATISYSGKFFKNNNSITGIDITSNSGDSIRFSGTDTSIISTGTANAINLVSNTATKIYFTGGKLDVDCTSGIGINATATGQVEITGSKNSINCNDGGSAIIFLNTTISASHINFESVSSIGGASPGTGIFLSNTGNLGGLQITGDMTSTSGGIISDKTGSDMDSLTGVGIFLSNCRSIVLNKMQLTNFQNFGILGYEVNGLTMSQIAVSSTTSNGTSTTLDEGSVSFGGSVVSRNGLSGTVSISNCTFEDGLENNLFFFNNSGTLNQLNLTNSVIQDNAAAGANDGMRIELTGSAIINADISGCSFLRNFNAGAGIYNSGSGMADVDFSGSTNTFTNNFVGIGLAISGNSGGDIKFNINGCLISAPLVALAGSPIYCSLSSTTTVSSLLSGNITNNTLSNNNSSPSPGIDVFTDGAGECRTNIAGNMISNIAHAGINMEATSSSKINTIISSNTINLTHASALEGIYMSSGLVSTNTTTICAKINQNTISTTTTLYDDILVRNRFAGTIFNIENLPGAPTNNVANIASYISSQNFLTGTVTATVNSNSFGNCFPPLPLNSLYDK